MRKIISLLLTAILVFLPCVCLGGDDPFVPIPEAEKKLYHFDFSKWFYQDEAARQKEIAEFHRLKEQVTSLKPQVTSSPERLLEAIELEQKMGIIAERLNAYGGLRFAVNTKDTVVRDEGEQASDDFDAATAYIKTSVQKMSDDEIKQFLDRSPGLARYKFLIQTWRRYQQHTALEPQETLLAQLSSRLDPFGNAFYTLMMGRTPEATLVVGQRSFNVTSQGDYSDLMRLEDRSRREEGFRKRLAALKSQNDLYTYSLFQKIKTANTVADVHRFPNSAVDESLYRYYLAPETVDAVLKSFRDHASLTIRFQQAERAYQQKVLGITNAQPWDLDARPSSAPEPRFVISDASRAVIGATQLLGPDYQNELNNLLDPRNGRLDIVGSENREAGDFTWGAYGPSWVFYMNGYNGYLTDVVTLAHESAHAVHSSLLYKANVPWYYSDGARYFTEGFAKVNELLILDYLLKNAKSDSERLFYLREFNSKLASVKFASMFWAAYATSFEVEAYRRVKSGDLKKPEELNDIWAELGRRWVLDFDRFPDMKYSWVGTHHFFDAPRYYSNYLFAWVLAVALYERFQNDPSAAEKYVKLMKAGFPDEPPALLREYLGIDLSDPKTLERTFATVEQHLADFEKLVK